MKNQGKLFFFCGKMGAGKSTKSKCVAAENNAILVSEDDWLSAHYPSQIQTFVECWGQRCHGFSSEYY
nr:AAA family ATPase [Vibrio neptunius]